MIIVVCGPTGVGKTKMSVELAKKYDAVILNADSMQVYKELNIGTAKVTEDEKQGVPHYLFDIKEPDEMYTVFDYQKDLREKLEEFKDRKTYKTICKITARWKSCCDAHSFEFITG